VVYEDGRQLRDFVNIRDAVAANLLVLDDPRADGCAFNVGGPRACTVEEFARIVCRAAGLDEAPRRPGLFRFGDTRHCLSDCSALRALGWAPRHGPERSVEDYLRYLREQTDIEDLLDYAERRMKDLDVLRRSDAAP
jgi:dTDP-L-rhamnose 4-epimerase